MWQAETGTREYRQSIVGSIALPPHGLANIWQNATRRHTPPRCCYARRAPKAAAAIVFRLTAATPKCSSHRDVPENILFTLVISRRRRTPCHYKMSRAVVRWLHSMYKPRQATCRAVVSRVCRVQRCYKEPEAAKHNAPHRRRHAVIKRRKSDMKVSIYYEARTYTVSMLGEPECHCHTVQESIGLRRGEMLVST